LPAFGGGKPLVRSPPLRDTFHVIGFSQFIQELPGGTFKRSQLHNTDDQSLLHAPGICRSAILFLGPPYTNVSVSLKVIGQWLDLYFHQTRSISNGKMPQILIESIIQARNILPKFQSIDSLKSYATFGEYSYLSYKEKELEGWRRVAVTLRSFDPADILSNPALEPQSTTQSNQPRWFISDRGQIGLAPCLAREGDLLCQFKECDVVALIRKRSLTGRGLLMPRWDEDSNGRINNSTGKFRYSIPEDSWFPRGYAEALATDRDQVSLYIDVKALLALTK
jgi:hypothetical protein